MLKLTRLKDHIKSTSITSGKDTTYIQTSHRDQLKNHLYFVTTVANKDIDQWTVVLGRRTTCQMLFGYLNQEMNK